MCELLSTDMVTIHLFSPLSIMVISNDFFAVDVTLRLGFTLIKAIANSVSEF